MRRHPTLLLTALPFTVFVRTTCILLLCITSKGQVGQHDGAAAQGRHERSLPGQDRCCPRGSGGVPGAVSGLPAALPCNLQPAPELKATRAGVAAASKAASSWNPKEGDWPYAPRRAGWWAKVGWPGRFRRATLSFRSPRYGTQ